MPKTPSYRERFKQGIVTLTDSATGKRRDYWLGPHGTPESRERYHRLVAEWEASGRRFPEALRNVEPSRRADDAPTVRHLVRAYWRWAKGYYRPNESATLRVALRLVTRCYGRTPIGAFGPSKLRVLRDAMVRGDAAASPPRRPWTRGYANHQVRRIKQMFRWGVSHEMAAPEVYHALAALEPLKRGRCAAREGRTVGPVPQAMLDAVRPHLSRPVRALMDLQLLTGARSGELLGLRAADLDTGDPSGVWAYRPKEHKNSLRGKDRIIYFGPAAQSTLRPFLANRPINAYLFSPAEAEAERRAAATARRRTPLSCGNRVGTNRAETPERFPGERYTPASYLIAVQRACERAYPPPERLRPRTKDDGKTETKREFRARLTPRDREELAAWRREHRWHPHQLRHNAATSIRREFGLEAAQLVLGHSSAKITDSVYAERDAGKTIEVARKIG